MTHDASTARPAMSKKPKAAAAAGGEKPRGFRQSMAWLHTWAGLLVGWILFTVFALGTASYYRTTITNWMQPERLLPATTPVHDDPVTSTADSHVTRPMNQQAQLQVTTQATRWLTRHAAAATRWTIALPGSGVTNATVSWEGPDGYHSRILPGVNGLTPRQTEGGDFFYDFHFQLHYLPIGVARWIIGICAMFMLVAIISGIVTHRRIFVDFFTFRPRKGQRSWLDAHNVTGVLALPYHLMITYTGLATLMTMLMPWGLQERYAAQDGMLPFYSEAYDFRLAGKASGQATPLPPIAPLLEHAMTRFGEHEAATIVIDNPGDAAAQIKVSRGSDARLSAAPQSITFDVHGKTVTTYDADNAVADTVGVMYGLHEARFASPGLRAVFFLSGLAGTLMVASGLIIWTNKQRQKRLSHGNRFHLGLWFVERLNLATIGGLPLAMAGFFYANRLIPALQAHRAALEIQAFFAVWAVAAMHAFLCRGRAGWIMQSVAGAMAFTLLPVIDRLTVGAWVMPGFDIALLAAAAVLGAMAWFLVKKSSGPDLDRMARANQTDRHETLSGPNATEGRRPASSALPHLPARSASESR